MHQGLSGINTIVSSKVKEMRAMEHKMLNVLYSTTGGTRGELV